MHVHNKVQWITRTAIFIALLIVLQLLTAPLGITLITGTLVNLVLIVSVMTSGPLTGLTVALVSPFAAKLVGIGPLWALVPFIAAGNSALIMLWHFIGNRTIGNKYATYIVTLAVGAAGKFLVLYIGIVIIAVPVLLNLPAKQAAVISATFSIPQLLTALMGGVLAIAILPLVKKAVNSKKDS